MNTGVKEKEIIEIMASVWNLDPEDIPADVELSSSPYWDSFGHIILLLGLEKKYKITIDYKVVTELISIPAIINYLNKEKHVR